MLSSSGAALVPLSSSRKVIDVGVAGVGLAVVVPSELIVTVCVNVALVSSVGVCASLRRMATLGPEHGSTMHWAYGPLAKFWPTIANGWKLPPRPRVLGVCAPKPLTEGVKPCTVKQLVHVSFVA